MNPKALSGPQSQWFEWRFSKSGSFPFFVDSLWGVFSLRLVSSYHLALLLVTHLVASHIVFRECFFLLAFT